MTLHERMINNYTTLVLAGKPIEEVPEKYRADVEVEIQKRKDLI